MSLFYSPPVLNTISNIYATLFSPRTESFVVKKGTTVKYNGNIPAGYDGSSLFC